MYPHSLESVNPSYVRNEFGAACHAPNLRLADRLRRELLHLLLNDDAPKQIRIVYKRIPYKSDSVPESEDLSIF